jgi:hypothetical protein
LHPLGLFQREFALGAAVGHHTKTTTLGRCRSLPRRGLGLLRSIPGSGIQTGRRLRNRQSPTANFLKRKAGPCQGEMVKEINTTVDEVETEWWSLYFSPRFSIPQHDT